MRVRIGDNWDNAVSTTSIGESFCIEAGTSIPAYIALNRARIVLCSMHVNAQLALVAQESGITSLLSKSNMLVVITAIEAALRGEGFLELQSETR